MNTTEGYQGRPGEGHWVSQESVLLGVGVGTGLLFALTLLAVIAALACRSQHVRRRRRSRRFPSTVSLAYSDFETYKVARPQSNSSPSTNLSTITSSSLSQLYANPYKARNTNKASHNAPSAGTSQTTASGASTRSSDQSQSAKSEETATMVFGGWRYIEPIVRPVASHTEERRPRQQISATTGRRHSDVIPIHSHPSPVTYNTRILSPDYSGKTKREDRTRPTNKMQAA